MTLDWSDALSASECSLGYTAGREAGHPLGEKQEFFAQWAPSIEELGFCHDREEALRWLLRTDLSGKVSGTGSFPTKSPPPAKNGRWRPAARKHVLKANVEVLGNEVKANAHIPALRKSKAGWEATYLDRRVRTRGAREWSRLVRYIGWHRACFEHATSWQLSARVLAPARRSERRVAVPTTKLKALVADVQMAKATARPEPGPYCRETNEEGAFKCPLRESGTCKPFSDLS